VTAVVKKIRGETVPTAVDTGVTVIDKENLDTPDVQKLVTP
jgi:ABC-type sugar transport system substrate-binding protein